MFLQLTSAEVFKGAVGEIMRPTGELMISCLQILKLIISLSLSLPLLSTTALRFIEKMCICSLPLPTPTTPEAASPQSVLETWQWIVDDNLPHTEESIREAAVSALTHLCTRYYSTDQETVKKAQGMAVMIV